MISSLRRRLSPTSTVDLPKVPSHASVINALASSTPKPSAPAPVHTLSSLPLWLSSLAATALALSVAALLPWASLYAGDYQPSPIGPFHIASLAQWTELLTAVCAAAGLNVLLAAACASRSHVALFTTAACLLPLPFVAPLRYAVSSVGLGLMLWIGVWKMLDVVGGTCAPAVLGSRWALALHFVVPVEYRHAHGRPEPARRGEAAAQLFELLLYVGAFAALLTLEEGAAAAVGAAAPPALARAARVYADVWKVYYFLRLFTGSNALILAALGVQPITVWRAPLLTSTSPSDFWAGRWNLLVHGLFKRSIFRPLVARGLPPTAAALLAFVVSGAFHEYAFMTPAGARPHLGHCFAFFVLQAPITTAEKLLRPRLAPLAARLPAALKIVGTSLLLIPLSPLFMAPLAHGGVLAELHTLLPKLVLS